MYVIITNPALLQVKNPGLNFVKHLMSTLKQINMPSFSSYSIQLKDDKLIKGTSSSEFEFISSLKQGNIRSFSILYHMYSPALLGIINRMIKNNEIAQDVLQLSFTKIWRSISMYDPAKGRLFTWMSKVARNVALDHFKSSECLKNGKTGCIDDFSHSIERLYPVIYNPETIFLRQHVNKLIPSEIEIIQLIYFQGYTHVAAAEELGIPLGSVKTQLRRAILNLRTFFKYQQV